MADLTTRPVTPEDFTFCWSLYAPTVQEHLAALIAGGWNAEKERERFRGIWQSDETHVIQYDGLPVGWISVRKGETEFEIQHLYVDPRYQRRGVASILINFVADEARKAGKHVSAEVLKSSTVLDMARKTGFLKVGTTELTHQIRRNP